MLDERGLGTCPMSGSGTKPTFLGCARVSAIRGKADNLDHAVGRWILASARALIFLPALLSMTSLSRRLRPNGINIKVPSHRRSCLFAFNAPADRRVRPTSGELWGTDATPRGNPALCRALVRGRSTVQSCAAAPSFPNDRGFLTGAPMGGTVDTTRLDRNRREPSRAASSGCSRA